MSTRSMLYRVAIYCAAVPLFITLTLKQPARAQDSDGDGLSDAEEAVLQTSPQLADTDRDGLSDGLEVNGLPDYDFRKLGANPLHADLLLFTLRRTAISEARAKAIVDLATAFYGNLPVQNPDGKDGVNLVSVKIGTTRPGDNDSGYHLMYSRYFPAELTGISHFIELYDGDAGQSPLLSDLGSAGAPDETKGWQTTVHELGHQLGLDHDGGGETGSPLHASLMNYDYDYSFRGSAEAIQFSDGKFASLNSVQRENGLDEFLPFPIESLDFLESPPYEYKLEATAGGTHVDWNRNRRFGEQGVAADINGAGGGFSIGEGQVVESAIHTAPMLFTAPSARLGVVYGVADQAGSDDLLGPGREGTVWLRRRPAGDGQWERTLVGNAAVGHPTAASFAGVVHVAYPVSGGGTLIFRFTENPNEGTPSGPFTRLFDRSAVIPAPAGSRPTLAVLAGRLYLLHWNPADGRVTYRIGDAAGDFSGTDLTLSRLTSPIEVGVGYDPRRGSKLDPSRGTVVVGFGDESTGSMRLALQRYRVKNDGRLTRSGRPVVVGGSAGGTATSERPSVVFDDSHRVDDEGTGTPNEGQLMLYYRALNQSDGKNGDMYVSREVRDRRYRGGWVERQTRGYWGAAAAPTALRFGDDVALARRSDTGPDTPPTSLHVHYRASGIEPERMADLNELEYIRNEGLVRSLDASRGGWSAWDSLPTAALPGTSAPVAHRDSSGRLQAFVVRTDANLWFTEQSAPGHAWIDWSSLSRPATDTLRSVAVANSANGQLEIFAPSANGDVWHLQRQTTGTFGAWQNRGRPSATRLGPTAFASTYGDQRVAIFSVGLDDGALWVAAQTTVNGGLGSWVSLGRPASRLRGPVVVAANSDGRREAFATAEDGNLWHVYQIANGSWSAWGNLGRPATAAIDGALTAASNTDGRLEVFAPASDGNVWHIYQVSPSSGWGSWLRLDQPAGAPFATASVAVVSRPSGLTLFGQSRDGRVWWTTQRPTDVADGWADWIRLGQPHTATVLRSGLATVLNHDGRAETLVLSDDGRVHNIYERAPR